MPARVIEDPLRIEFEFSRGIHYTLDLAYLPCPQLVRDLATGLANMTHPHGEVDAAATAFHYRMAIAQLSRFLHAAGFTDGASRLTRARLVEFWLGHKPDIERMTRATLRSLDAHTGALRPEVREYLDGPPLKRRTRTGKSLPPYGKAEWDRLLRCCEKITEDSLIRHRAALVQARGGQDPLVAGWAPMANRLWLLVRHGPLTQVQVGRYLGCARNTVRSWGSVDQAACLLFPTLEVALAYRLLLGMTSGIVPDGLDDLGLDDVEWAGDTTVLLEYVKGRTRRESLNLPAPAVRVLRRWLEHSALLRQFAGDSQRSALWLAYSSVGGRTPTVTVPGFDALTVRRWVEAHELVGDDGELLRVHRHRIRTTFEQRRDKSAWTGRTTIDPNHTAEVEGDHYLSQLTPAQQDAVNAVIEQAQADLVRKAHTPLVLASEATEHAASQLPQRIAGLVLTETVVAELVGGQRDVFTAACADQLAGLHGPHGTPCPARPW